MKNPKKPIIGIMGPGDPDNEEITDQAETLGRLIAEKGWMLLTGGRNAGVMDAASKGADKAGGTVIGILPSADKHRMSAHVHVPIPTGMGSARNMINILAADLIIVCGMGLGTASEAALAIKQGKPIIFTCVKPDQVAFFEVLCKRTLDRLENPAQIIRKAEKLLRL